MIGHYGIGFGNNNINDEEMIAWNEAGIRDSIEDLKRMESEKEMHPHDAFRISKERIDDILSNINKTKCYYTRANIDENNHYAIRHVTVTGQLDVFVWLVERGARLHLNGSLPIKNMIQYDHLPMLKWVQEKGYLARNVNYNIVIQIAALCGHLDIVQWILQLGFDIHWNTDMPIRAAAGGGSTVILTYLMTKGANVRALDDDAIQWAAENGHLYMVKFLMKLGLDIHCHNHYALRSSVENATTYTGYQNHPFPEFSARRTNPGVAYIQSNVVARYILSLGRISIDPMDNLRLHPDYSRVYVIVRETTRQCIGIIECMRELRIPHGLDCEIISYVCPFIGAMYKDVEKIIQKVESERTIS